MSLVSQDPVVVVKVVEIYSKSKKLIFGKIKNKGIHPISINIGQDKKSAYTLDFKSNLISIFLLAKYIALERNIVSINKDKNGKKFKVNFTQHKTTIREEIDIVKRTMAIKFRAD